MPQKCTEDVLMRLFEIILNGKKRKLFTTLVFLDIKGAFDNAWWPAILSPFRSANIPSNLFSVISSFLKERTATSSLDHCSKERPLQKGYPQGSVSGPLLWNIIINNLLDKDSTFSCSETIAFADDLLPCFQGKTLQDINREAQRILDFVLNWAKVMILDRRERNTFTSALTLHGIPLCFVKELKYLGVILDSKCCWKQHIFYLSKKCENILLGLNRVAKNTFGLKSNVTSLIYKQETLSSLYALTCITSPNRLIVKTQTNLNFLQGRGVQVFFSFVRGHIGIYGNGRTDWLAKEATKLIDFIPMTVPKSFYKSVFKKHVISQ
ncbi:hypothetical protein AVEN_15461-1 [Araneus ventricosus]|uniref:Reverse transcriptase domain-containing protein n=1 Tax=Araneus ventricosus TaxID=182803 RepID=A0A4Y2EFL5_ARAVE|nr:hypothetical protein AVEN_15461-1 [Araneus ventricosus]